MEGRYPDNYWRTLTGATGDTPLGNFLDSDSQEWIPFPESHDDESDDFTSTNDYTEVPVYEQFFASSTDSFQRTTSEDSDSDSATLVIESVRVTRLKAPRSLLPFLFDCETVAFPFDDYRQTTNDNFSTYTQSDDFENCKQRCQNFDQQNDFLGEFPPLQVTWMESRSPSPCVAKGHTHAQSPCSGEQLYLTPGTQRHLVDDVTQSHQHGATSGESCPSAIFRVGELCPTQTSANYVKSTESHQSLTCEGNSNKTDQSRQQPAISSKNRTLSTCKTFEGSEFPSSSTGPTVSESGDNRFCSLGDSIDKASSNDSESALRLHQAYAKTEKTSAANHSTLEQSNVFCQGEPTVVEESSSLESESVFLETVNSANAGNVTAALLAEEDEMRHCQNWVDAKHFTETVLPQEKATEECCDANEEFCDDPTGDTMRVGEYYDKPDHVTPCDTDTYLGCVETFTKCYDSVRQTNGSSADKPSKQKASNDAASTVNVNSSTHKYFEYNMQADGSSKINANSLKNQKTLTHTERGENVISTELDKIVTPAERDQTITSIEADKIVTSTAPDKIVTVVEPDKIVISTELDKLVTSTGPNKIVTPAEPDKIITSIEPGKTVTSITADVSPTDFDINLAPTEPDQNDTLTEPDKNGTSTESEETSFLSFIGDEEFSQREKSSQSKADAVMDYSLTEEQESEGPLKELKSSPYLDVTQCTAEQDILRTPILILSSEESIDASTSETKGKHGKLRKKYSVHRDLVNASDMPKLSEKDTAKQCKAYKDLTSRGIKPHLVRSTLGNGKALSQVSPTASNDTRSTVEFQKCSTLGLIHPSKRHLSPTSGKYTNHKVTKRSNISQFVEPVHTKGKLQDQDLTIKNSHMTTRTNSEGSSIQISKSGNGSQLQENVVSSTLTSEPPRQDKSRASVKVKHSKRKGKAVPNMNKPSKTNDVSETTKEDDGEKHTESSRPKETPLPVIFKTSKTGDCVRVCSPTDVKCYIVSSERTEAGGEVQHINSSRRKGTPLPNIYKTSRKNDTVSEVTKAHSEVRHTKSIRRKLTPLPNIYKVSRKTHNVSGTTKPESRVKHMISSKRKMTPLPNIFEPSKINHYARDPRPIGVKYYIDSSASPEYEDDFEDDCGDASTDDSASDYKDTDYSDHDDWEEFSEESQDTQHTVLSTQSVSYLSPRQLVPYSDQELSSQGSTPSRSTSNSRRNFLPPINPTKPCVSKTASAGHEKPRKAVKLPKLSSAPLKSVKTVNRHKSTVRWLDDAVEFIPQYEEVDTIISKEWRGQTASVFKEKMPVKTTNLRGVLSAKSLKKAIVITNRKKPKCTSAKKKKQAKRVEAYSADRNVIENRANWPPFNTKVQQEARLRAINPAANRIRDDYMERLFI